MKTFKHFPALLFLLCLTSLMNAQSVVTKTMSKFRAVTIPCTGERLIGYINYHAVALFDKNGNPSGFHVIYAGGELVGQTTGNIYNYKSTFIDNYKAPWPEDTDLYNGAYVETFISTGVITCRGNKSVNYIHRTLYNLVIKPDGEIILQEMDNETICH